MNGNRYRYLIRFFLTVILGFLATAINVSASSYSKAVAVFCSNTKPDIDFLNSMFALLTASITIVYIYFQIKKLRKELKK